MNVSLYRDDGIFDVLWEAPEAGYLLFAFTGILMEGRNVKEIAWSNLGGRNSPPALDSSDWRVGPGT